VAVLWRYGKFVTCIGNSHLGSIRYLATVHFIRGKHHCEKRRTGLVLVENLEGMTEDGFEDADLRSDIAEANRLSAYEDCTVIIR
jgi:hypothetical protein